MDRIQRRFDQLEDMADQIAGTKNVRTTTSGGGTSWVGRRPIPVQTHKTESFDFELCVQWQTSVLSLLSRVLGDQSPVFVRFEQALDNGCANDVTEFQYRRSIFQAAKDDFEGGYLFDVRNLIHAEVFSTELEQAEHFLKNKYDVAAAVTTGVVLETTVKKICEQQSPPISVLNDKGKGKTTDTLISELKNAEIYNEAVAKQLRAWMNVRNDAAHGKRKDGEFEDGEIRRMIDGVGDFVAKHMS